MVGLIVSFGSTATKRLTLFLGNSVTHIHATTPFFHPSHLPPVLFFVHYHLNLMYSSSYYPTSLLLLNSLKELYVYFFISTLFIYQIHLASPLHHYMETPSPQQLL